jgi:hypothetical protein
MVHDSLWQNNKNQVHLKVWEYDGTIFLSAIVMMILVLFGKGRMERAVFPLL